MTLSTQREFRAPADSETLLCPGIHPIKSLVRGGIWIYSTKGNRRVKEKVMH